MKRRGLIAVLAALMVMMSMVFCYADTDGLTLLSTYPKDGQKNTSMENVGVKLHFSNPVTTKAAKNIDEKAVKIVDQDGKKVPIEVLFSNKKDGYVLVLADTVDSNYTVKNNSEYKLTISKDFVDDYGNTLGKTETVTFKTYNQRVNSIVNMAMMFVMFGGIMVLTMKQQKDQQEEEKNKDKNASESAFNPYKEAKKTGKSLEEVIAEEEKRQAKLAKKNKKKGVPEKSKKKKIICADYLNNVYHVHAPAPIHKAKKKKGGKASK